NTDENYIEEFFKFFTDYCQEENIELIGGDTTGSHSDLMISITALGHAHPDNITYRHTAQQEDLICYVGHLGYAKMGLLACENNALNNNIFQQSFLRPKAKIREGLWLAAQEAVSSMMDISDGFYADIKKLCTASQLKAEVN